MRFAMNAAQVHKVTKTSIPVMPPQTPAAIVIISIPPDSSVSLGSGLTSVVVRSVVLVLMVSTKSVERSIAVVATCSGSESELHVYAV